MKFFVGTSGYSYKEWKGSFYPAKITPKEMLEYYAQRFSTVEINNSFYRMPRVSDVEAWAAQVPESFRFVLKAPQTITHRKRLKEAGDSTDFLFQTASALKERQGPVLFQLPPNLKKDLPRLETFLELLIGRPSAFEFRHESWCDDEVAACLRARSCALAVGDTDELPATKIVSTADWGYLRLRRADYSDDELRGWLDKIREQNWREAYVFFKHEDTGTAPRFAARFLELTA